MSDAVQPNTAASDYFQRLQDRICSALEALEPVARFTQDVWPRPDGGGGRSRVLTSGQVFEKAGVNFSEVYGNLPADLAGQMPGHGIRFWASGISLVLHPQSPMVPTVHANFRCLRHGKAEWYGGGADLTPYYPYAEDIIHFHKTWKRVCIAYGDVVDYARLKQWCDEYFFLPHRNEARGVGGIFFDYLQGPGDHLLQFVRSCGDTFLEAYLPIVHRRKDEPYTASQRAFQEYRRSRYVEFNLIYDRGTLFGLKTGGRTESILMSLPPVARWPYDFHPEPGSREAELSLFLRPRPWADEPVD